MENKVTEFNFIENEVNFRKLALTVKEAVKIIDKYPDLEEAKQTKVALANIQYTLAKVL